MWEELICPGDSPMLGKSLGNWSLLEFQVYKAIEEKKKKNQLLKSEPILAEK